MQEILILAHGASTGDLVASTRLEKERSEAMVTINMDELMDDVKDFLEKIGCTDIKINDIPTKPATKALTTREAMAKLPKAAQDRIERFRSDMKVDSRHREVYISKGCGYIEGLRDAGIITEQESKMLKCYLTI